MDWRRYAWDRIRAAAAEGVRSAAQRASERIAEGIASAGARIADVLAPPPPPAPARSVSSGEGWESSGSEVATPRWGEGWWDAPPGVSIEIVDELPEDAALRGPFLAASDAAEYASDIPVPTRIVRLGALFYVIVVYED